MKGKVYRVKEDVDFNIFGEMGYEIVPSEPIVLCKVIEQPFEGELVQGSLNGIYNNGKWRSKIFAPHEKEMSETLGLKYKRGKAVISEVFRHVLTDWRIQIEPYGDRWLGFASLDPFDKMVYYSYVHLDQYCKDEINTLMEKGFIELIEVDDEDIQRNAEEKERKESIPDDVDEIFELVK